MMFTHLKTATLVFVGLALANPGLAEPPRAPVEHTSPILCLTWSPDGKWVATGTEDGTIHIIGVDQGKEIRSLPTRYNQVLIDVASGNETRSTATRGAVTAMAVSHDGKMLSLIESRSTISILDVYSGTCLRIVGPTLEANLQAFMADGDTVVSLGPNFVSLLKVTGDYTDVKVAGLQGGIMGISPDGLAHGWYDSPSGFLIFRRHESNAYAVHTVQIGRISSMAFGPRGTLVAVGGGDYRGVQLWDIAKKKKTNLLSGLDKSATKLSISADGKTVAAIPSDGATLCVWDVANTTPRRWIRSPYRGEFSLLALSPDGQKLATAAKDSKALLLWDVSSRKLAEVGPPLNLPANDLTRLWGDLANMDYGKANNAWHKLVAASDSAIPFIAQQIRPIVAPEADRKAIESLTTDLNSDRYATRERAIKALIPFGDLATGPLQRLVTKPPSLEAATRAKALLKKLGEPVLTPDRFRVLEAIDLLEHLGTAPAISLLQEIERDALIGQIQCEAGRALERVAQSKEKSRSN